MRTPPAWALVLALTALVGCTPDPPGSVELQPAQLEVSSGYVEFGEVGTGEILTKTVTLTNSGEVHLGIASIELGSTLAAESGHGGAFELEWEAANGEPEWPELSLVLPPGASQPVEVSFSPVVGEDNYDALIVTTREGPVDWNDPIAVDQRIYADRDNQWKMTYLHGYSADTVPDLVVSPRDLDFGFVWPGQVESRYVSLENVGDGDLVLGYITTKKGACSEGFELVSFPPGGTVVQGDAATLVEVSYSPPGDTVSRAECTVLVPSNDAADPEVEVRFTANSGTNPANTCPEVTIHAPEPGYVHEGWLPLELELTLFDADQPPQTLVCKVRSVLQLGAAVADCTPTTESGQVTIEVPVEGLYESGLEVLVIQVTDDAECTRKASVPVLIHEARPGDDEDGDGFSPSDEDLPDCDDSDPTIYPYAAEAWDGVDNDCDLTVDEGTDGVDDDGDGVTEAEGDCDDNNPDTYPGAPERQDNADNDCDGTVDEHTDAYDDDGDGFSELELDCNDADPNLHPAAEERCGDGIDNNCNGLVDTQEACVSLDSVPMLVGRVQLSRTTIEEGGAVQASVLVYEADGDTVSHEWQSKDDEGHIDDPSAPAITWSAPTALPQGYSEGNVYRLYYVGRDDDEHEIWDYAEVWMVATGELSAPIVVSAAEP